jgi:uncharacterized protein YjbJ (UPF0337 family)
MTTGTLSSFTVAVRPALAFRTPDHRVFREAAQQRRERRCGDISDARFRGGDITTRRITMNTDQFKGKWVQFKGEVKKQWGKLTDDDLMQVEGDYDKFVGRVQERYGDKKEEVVRWADDWYTQQGRPANRSTPGSTPSVDGGKPVFIDYQRHSYRCITRSIRDMKKIIAMALTVRSSGESRLGIVRNQQAVGLHRVGHA